jgi:hypothetical protein
VFVFFPSTIPNGEKDARPNPIEGCKRFPLHTLLTGKEGTPTNNST